MQDPRLIRSAAAFVFVFCTLLISPFVTSAGDKPTEIKVAYFQQWPAPVQFAQANRTFDSMLGMKVNWVPFRSGRDMAKALAAGDVQIAYSLGHVPFLVAINSGLDLSMVGIAVSYPENDNCIVLGDAGIDRANAQQMEGRKVALRPGSVSHFRFLKVLAHLGVDHSRVGILPVANGNSALQALQQGEAAMACASGSALRGMAKLGKPLLSGVQQQALGLMMFDVIAVTTEFGEQHPDIVEAFMEVTEAANQQWSVNPDPMLRLIARKAEMDRNSASYALQSFQFPLAAEQKSEAWIGGSVSAYSGEIARFFVAQGQLERSLDSYDRFVTSRFLP
jgi:taurine transport system substrate-binding protein